MSEIIYDVETASEVYKEYIRGAEYGDVVSKTTSEYMIFIYKEKRITVSFKLKFSYDFDDGFTNTKFSDFSYSSNLPDDEKKEFQACIENGFVTCDRLSC